MEKRTLIALALSLAVITGYPYLVKVFYPNYGTVTRTATTAAPEAAAPSAPQTAPLATAGTVAPDKPDTKSGFDVASYRVEISQNYASILMLAFTNYSNTEDKTPLKFLDASDGRWGAGAVHLFINDKEQGPAWQTQTEAGSIRAVSSAADHQITKAIVFSEKSYINKMSLSYTNKSSAEQKIRLRLVAGSGLFVRNAIDTQYFESNWIGDNTLEHMKVSKGKTKLGEHPYKAVSIKSRHFSSILMPFTGTGYVPGLQGLPGKHDYAAFMTGPAPGATRSTSRA